MSDPLEDAVLELFSDYEQEHKVQCLGCSNREHLHAFRAGYAAGRASWRRHMSASLEDVADATIAELVQLLADAVVNSSGPETMRINASYQEAVSVLTALLKAHAEAARQAGFADGWCHASCHELSGGGVHEAVCQDLHTNLRAAQPPALGVCDTCGGYRTIRYKSGLKTCPDCPAPDAQPPETEVPEHFTMPGGTKPHRPAPDAEREESSQEVRRIRHAAHPCIDCWNKGWDDRGNAMLRQAPEPAPPDRKEPEPDAPTTHYVGQDDDDPDKYPLSRLD